MPDLRQLLLAYRPTPAEAAHQRAMLALLESEPRCFHRDAFPAHFTGSALVISACGRRVLLNHHRRLGRWMQFGGHCDGDADILRVAAREAWEESGIAGLTPVFTTPLDLDIHPIPARPGEPAHEHYDVRFLLRAPEGATFQCSEESNELAWFPWDAVPEMDAGCQRMLAKAV